MAVRKINESTLTAIGNAIRSKTGGSALINPEDMADEIGNISTGGGIVLPPNMLESLTWEHGYFSSTGSISASSTTKELYCNEFIIVDSSERYFVGQKSPSSNTTALWVGIGLYDTNKGFITRLVPDGLNGQQTYTAPTWFATFKTSATTEYIRFSFRSFGESSLYMCKASDFYDAIKDSAVNLIY